MYKNSVQRFREIVKVLSYYGFGYIVNSKIKNSQNSPRNLRKAFEELGPTFIKIGQVLSTMPNFLPEAYIDELSKLQDSAPPESIEAINNVFRTEFSKEIADSFSEFDNIPLASASIAQVHSAKLKDGRRVIVKIQRPDIEEELKMDISILGRIIKFTKPKFLDKLIDPKAALDELLYATEQELNFRNEAKNMEAFQKLNKNVAFIYVPSVVWELTGLKVLTMEKLEGFKITDVEGLNNAGYDLNDIGKKLALSYFKQVFSDGFFHGDPHPGNLIINEGKICFIDFGITGNLTNEMRHSLNEAIIAIAYKDINKLISVLLSIGIKKGSVSKAWLYEDLEYLFEKYLSTSLENIKVASLFKDIFDAANRNNLSLPKDLTILARGVVIMEGVVSKVSPDIKILDVALPFVKYNSRITLLNDLNFDEMLLQSHKLLKDIFKTPSKLLELIDSAINGRTNLQLELKGMTRSINELNKMTNRIVFSLVVASLIIGSSNILSSNIGPKIYNISIIGITGFLAAAFMGIWLLISILKSGRM